MNHPLSEAPGISVQQLTVGPLQENAWLVLDHQSEQAVLIDPGDEPAHLLRAVEESGCRLVAIWLTHAHFDHVGAIAGVVAQQPVPIWLHPADAFFYANAADNAARWGVQIENPPVAGQTLAEGDVVRLGAHEFTVWHLPGHSPGHVAFIGHGLCFSGDVLFAGSIGRTDLPLCDPAAMQQSLMRMATLPPETRVLSGHGVMTSIGRELSSNPFLRGLARPVGA